ncbi:DUF2956 domain-containing protein [Vibrio cincinnatiensis]|uniref:DUF2956 domain-containing protein n=1 Tax=Vibrio cincinnatiensis TaxID=675 RepID=UPI001EE03BB3|nr:DUF2956 domain-containing protein [Vibrio cincinnatiensis]MCG3730913.1 DUF2956 domain-containing protein [Vibrio cincinnatiensis]
MKKNVIPSPQTQQEAMSIAKATQKPGQTKEQTKLIAQGIEKGIALYKKQQKEKNRQADKARKKLLKDKSPSANEDDNTHLTNHSVTATSRYLILLPWALLLASWLGFAAFWLR